MGNTANLHTDDSEDCLDRIVIAQDTQQEHWLSKLRNLRALVAGLSIVFVQILRILTEHTQDSTLPRALIPTIAGLNGNPHHPFYPCFLNQLTILVLAQTKLNSESNFVTHSLISQ